MANKKVISAIAIASTVLVAGSAFAVAAATTDFLSPNAADAHHLVWESEPTPVGEKFIMYGDEHGEIEVKSTNAVEGGKVLALGENGSFENVSPIGKISSVELTYTVGTETTPHDGTASSVLKAQFGYMIAGNNPTVYYQEPVAMANKLTFADAQPSFVRFISTTAETINIDKIEIFYGCKEHDYVNAITNDGLYLVGKGSFVKNNADWVAFGGILMTKNGGQHEVVVDFKKGDHFSFQEINNHVATNTNWGLKSGDANAYKEAEGHNIEILHDCKLGIYLKDNAELYLEVVEPAFTTPTFTIELVNTNTEGKGFGEGKVPYLIGIDSWEKGVAFGENYTYRMSVALGKTVEFKIAPLDENNNVDWNNEINNGGNNFKYEFKDPLHVYAKISFDFNEFGTGKKSANVSYLTSAIAF